MNDKYILDVKTVQSSNIKILFEVLKEVLLGDINLLFTPTYIKSTEINESKMAMAYLNLKAEAFEHYYCEKEIIVGINTTEIYKIIKIVNSSDTISMCIERNKNDILIIRMENSADNKIFESRIRLLDIDYVSMEIPNIEFPSIISLPSSKFQKCIKNLNSLGTDCILEIKSVGQQITFSCEGTFSKNKAIFGLSDDTSFQVDNANDVIQGKFYIKFLVLFTKATSLCQTVHIYLKNDYSIILEYTVGNLGALRFILHPIL